MILTNGLIKQWARLHSNNNTLDIDGKKGYFIFDSADVILPVLFTKSNYVVSLEGEDTPRGVDDYIWGSFCIANNPLSKFTATYYGGSEGWDTAVWWCNWFAVGF